jgi:hypothetical protein
MPWADCCRAAVAALCLAGCITATAADPPAYGKVDTFEPGKKYNCVPSADRKSWDCTQAGKATKDDVPSAVPAPRHDEPAPAAAKPSPPAPAATAPPPSAPASASHTGKLPSYLLAPGASDHATPAPTSPAPVAPAPAAPAKPVAAPEVHTSTNPQPATPTAQPKPAPPATPAPEISPKPATESPKPVAPAPTTAAPVEVAPTPRTPAPPPAPPARPQAVDHGGEFLNLSGEQYVIELAHGDQASVAAARHALNLPHGQAYELHLRQNGADTWLLVWGSFDDVGAARDARGELPADVHAGWPRRVAPLQAEVRRAQE